MDFLMALIIVCVLLFIYYFGMYEGKQMMNKKLTESFNRGYDYAVKCMIKKGYWHEKGSGPRHNGKWVEYDV